MTDRQDELVMYVIVNKGLGMSPGKVAAQVAHAALNAYVMSAGAEPEQTAAWMRDSQTKIVLEADDAEHINRIMLELASLKISSSDIHDQGRTEIPRGSLTALGITIVPKYLLAMTLGDLSLYR